MAFIISRATKSASVEFERATLEGALALATELIAAEIPRSVVRIMNDETGTIYEESEILDLQKKQDGRRSCR